MPECQGKNCTIIKELLDSNSLNCQSCKKLLQLPVFLVDGVGNVCANCRLKNTKWKSTGNKIFNVLLKNLIIPCANEAVGCDEEIPYERFEQHLKLCKYRPVKCPQQGCTWTERHDNLPNHFLENHQENVIESKTFSFGLDLKEASVDFAKLLIKANLKFLFILHQDKKADELSLSLFKCSENFPSSTTITLSGNKELERHSFQASINTLDLIDQKHRKVMKINLTWLDAMLQQGDKLSFNVDLPPSNHVLQILECPVCNVTMRPPIYKCEKGHSICNDCVGKIKTCPKCHAAISGGTRNYALENWTSEMYYYCSYKFAGCTAVLSGDEIIDHKSNCLHRFYKCPLDNCRSSYNFKNIFQHVSVEHADVTNQFEFTISSHGHYNFKSALKACMFFKGWFFRAEYLRINKVPPKCSPPSHPMQYAFIQFEHLNPEKRLINLYCKNTLMNTKTKDEVTQIQFLRNAEKDQNLYYVFVPIQALSDSVDVSRTGICRFKCQILMK